MEWHFAKRPNRKDKIQMKYLLTLFLSGVFIFACASSSTTETNDASNAQQVLELTPNGDSLHMVFNLKNQPAGKTKLVGMYEDQRFIVDSAVIDANGHFEITRKNLLPQGFYYFILPGQKALQFLMDRDQIFEFSGDMANINTTAQVKGSRCIELFYDGMKFDATSGLGPKIQAVASKLSLPSNSPEFKAALKEYNRLLDQVDQKIASYQKTDPDNFFTKFKVGGQNPRLKYPVKTDGTLDTTKQVYDYRVHFWDGYDFAEKNLLRTPVFANKIKRFFTELIPLQQDSIIKYTDILVAKAGDNPAYFRAITNWVALKFEPAHTNLMDGEAVYSHIIGKYFTDEKATWSKPEDLQKLRQRASEMTQSLIGKKAGNVTANDRNGKSQTLYDLKGGVVVVFIYSPDCEHCRKQTPILKGIYKKWHDKGVDIYSIAANTTEKEWRGFDAQFHLPWTDVFDATNASWYPKYFVDITPEVYVLDKNRKIVAKNINVKQLPTLFKRYLK